MKDRIYAKHMVSDIIEFFRGYLPPPESLKCAAALVELLYQTRKENTNPDRIDEYIAEAVKAPEATDLIFSSGLRLIPRFNRNESAAFRRLLRGLSESSEEEFAAMADELVDCAAALKNSHRFTPRTVAHLAARLLGPTPQAAAVYDPACGSGSMLLAALEKMPGCRPAGEETEGDVLDLAKFSLKLHGAENASDRLTQSGFGSQTTFSPEETFDVIVSNPPFSVRPDSQTGNFSQVSGFDFPVKSTNSAFLARMLSALKTGGKMAVIQPHGILFRRSDEEIRRYLAERGYLKAIIGLPENLFMGTAIPVVILVVEKTEIAGGDGIFMIDAAREPCKKERGYQALTEESVQKIASIYETKREIENFSRAIPFDEIEKNGFLLNVSRYISAPAQEKRVDLDQIDARISQIDAEMNEIAAKLRSHMKIFDDLP